jgi:capsular exopolysaccharide synthesis family protein
VLRERWLLVFVAALIGVVAAGTMFSIREPEYTARSSLYVSATGALDAASAAYGAQLSVQRVKSYVELVGSLRVSSDVVQQLGLPESPAELVKKITGSTPLDTVIINIDVVDKSPERAAAIADAVGDALRELPADLDRDSQVGQSTIDVRWVQKADVPKAPSSTGLTLSLALGLLAGLVIGVGGALLRESLDTSVRTPQQLRDATGTSIRGVIGYDRRLRERPLVAYEDPWSPVSEELQQLRANLRVNGADAAHKSIVVTSAVHREGKTTLVANLAIAAAAAGSRVLVVEGDLRRPKLADVLGLERSYGLVDVLAGRVRLDEAIRQWGNGTFDVLFSGRAPGSSGYVLAAEGMRTMVRELEEQYDLVLIDSAPLLRFPEAPQVAAVADGAILVCHYRRATREQVATAADILRSVSTPVLGAVLTMAPRRGGLARWRPVPQPLVRAELNGHGGAAPGTRDQALLGPGPTSQA